MNLYFFCFYLRTQTSLLVVKGTGQPKISKRKILLLKNNVYCEKIKTAAFYTKKSEQQTTHYFIICITLFILLFNI